MIEGKWVHCDFCGLDFQPSCADQSCQGCPLARGCSKITCPRCGYSILPEAKLIGWIRSLAGPKSGPRASSVKKKEAKP